MKNLILTVFVALLLVGCSSSKTYEVKGYKVYSESEVYVKTVLETGHIEEIVCAFPPGTQYEKMKKVKVGEVKKEYLFGQVSYYCNAIY